MPLWWIHRSKPSELSDSNTSNLLLANLNEYEQKKSWDADSGHPSYAALYGQRPRTAHGAPSHSRHQDIIIPGLGCDHDYSYLASMGTSLACASSNDLSTGRSDSIIGVALGSPSLLQCSQLVAHDSPPPSHKSPTPRPSVIRAQSAQPTNAAPLHSKLPAPPPPEPTPKLKRWRTVGGLLKRVKTQNQKPQASEIRPSTSAGHGESWRPRSRSKRSLKPRTPTPTNTDGELAWEQIAKKSSWLRSGQAPRSDTSDTLRPQLDVSIPDSGFERYSIMFSDVLQDPHRQATPAARMKKSILTRRQNGIDNLTILSPTHTADEGSKIRRMPSVRGRRPPTQPLSLFPALSPPPVTPHSETYDSTGASNNALRRSKSASALLTTPTEDTFLKGGCQSPKRAKSERMPHTPPLTAFFSSFPMPKGTLGDSPATFAEAWDDEHVSIDPRDVKLDSDYDYLSKFLSKKPHTERSPADHAQDWEYDEKEASNYTHSPPPLTSAISDPPSSSPNSFLTVDVSPQPTSLMAPSPQKTHGYDAPHSPLIEMARQVCVTNVQSARASVHIPAHSARTSVQLLERCAAPKSDDVSRKPGVLAKAGKGSVSTLGTASRTPTVVREGEGAKRIPRRRSVNVEYEDEDVEMVWKEVETAWGVRESRIGLGVLV